MKDTELRQHVIDELRFEPSLDSADIGVMAERGVVTLSGYVSSYAEKLSAERAAWRVRGVKAIALDIQVRLPADLRLHDDQIARRVLDVLAWNTAVPASSIKVRVEGGLVTLSGRVAWNYQRLAAETAIRNLPGVIGILDQIAVEPTVPAIEVKDRIVDVLTRNAEIEASRIKVEVHEGGAVTLEGDVDSWSERQALRRAAWSVPGVSQVNDHLRIC